MSKAVITCGWDDVPHLSALEKNDLLKSFPAHQRDARSKGVPRMGVGLIFLSPEEEIICKPFQIPEFWKFLGGMDFGGSGHPTAGVVGALDADADCLYLIGGYKRSGQNADTNSGALKRLCPGIQWAWPSDGMQHDKGSAEQIAKQYRDAGLQLLKEFARFPETKDKTERARSRTSVEAGIFEMQQRFDTGRLKVFETFTMYIDEYREYHRDDNGKIVKIKDDLICASRYMMMMLRFAKPRSPQKKTHSRTIDFQPLDREMNY